MLELDGSHGEGGGQILRSSLALSLLTGRPFHLRNIRARRPKPGLRPQHLMSVQAASRIGEAKVSGASLNSSDVVFEPGIVQAGNFHFPIRTAGAVSLVLHTIYLPLILRGKAASSISVEGGTHVSNSPCFHFLEQTWRGYMELLGFEMTLRMHQTGFYPRGGGLVEAQLQPATQVRPLNLKQRKDIRRITGFSAVAGLPREIASRQARHAANRLKQAGWKARLTEEEWPGGPGTVLALIVQTEPVSILFFGLGALGKRAERVADEAVDQLLAYRDSAPAAVDPHSADQLVLPLAFATGPTEFTVTNVTSHLLTNISTIHQFLNRKIICQGGEGEPGVVKIFLEKVLPVLNKQFHNGWLIQLVCFKILVRPGMGPVLGNLPKDIKAPKKAQP